MEDILSQSTPKIMETALEYSQLAFLPHPSAEESDKLAAILATAIENEVLSFWIAEVDHCLGHHLGLLNEDSRESYMDQQALLREHLGQRICITPPRKALKISSRK